MINKIYKTSRNLIKKTYYKFENFKLFIRRKKGKIFFKFNLNKKFANNYSFAILCIKKVEYADMAIVNVNSLLSLNPTHKFILYCDTICADYLNVKINEFDYPEKVSILDKFGITEKAWQYYKIEVHIEAAKNNQIDTDADGVWHNDPILDRNKITMLAHAHDFSSKENEVLTLKNIFPNNPEFLKYRHCVAAFVSMPSKFINDKVADDMRNINHRLFTDSYSFLSSEKERGDAKRLSEEFAVNLAVQSNYSQDNLIVLKSEDGWGNKKILQSLYYGCGNQINE